MRAKLGLPGPPATSGYSRRGCTCALSGKLKLKGEELYSFVEGGTGRERAGCRARNGRSGRGRLVDGAHDWLADVRLCRFETRKKRPRLAVCMEDDVTTPA